MDSKEHILQTGRLFSLPDEILGNVLRYCPFSTLASFSLSCKRASIFLAPENQALWREAYLNLFDEPLKPSLPGCVAAKTPSLGDYGWYSNLRDRCLAGRLALSQDPGSIRCNALHTERCVAALLDIVDTAAIPAAKSSEETLRSRVSESKNLQWLEKLFAAQPVDEGFVHDFHPAALDFPISRPSKESSCQEKGSNKGARSDQHDDKYGLSPSDNACRLHIFHGLTSRERKSATARGVARYRVYDWAYSKDELDYSPLKEDGTVQWQQLESLFSVVARNFECVLQAQPFVHLSRRPFNAGHTRNRLRMPMGFRYAVPNFLPLIPEMPRDWARITGTWLGTYCFLDYSDLYYFNAGYRPNERPSLDDYEEACGDLMCLTLALADPESEADAPIFSDPALSSELPNDDRLPVLFFRGVSRGATSSNHSPAINVRGRVNLIPGGREVRWRFIISYAGGDQWQLEGVQPGGPGGGGVYGQWTHVDHEPGGPLGPFCYFPEKFCAVEPGDEEDEKKKHTAGKRRASHGSLTDADTPDGDGMLLRNGTMVHLAWS
ncbi:MAG: hypothetical protein Q9227_007819 [Pyrenula ochraceoflavens]